MDLIKTVRGILEQNEGIAVVGDNLIDHLADGSLPTYTGEPKVQIERLGEFHIAPRIGLYSVRELNEFLLKLRNHDFKDIPNPENYPHEDILDFIESSDYISCGSIGLAMQIGIAGSRSYKRIISPEQLATASKSPGLNPHDDFVSDIVHEYPLFEIATIEVLPNKQLAEKAVAGEFEPKMYSIYHSMLQEFASVK